MTRHDGIACLDVLAAQLHARGWTACITLRAGRLTALSVQDPHDRAQWSDVIAAPGGATGDWWYWFSWAERIGPVHAPAAAAEVIIRALQRPMDGAVLAGCEAAHGERQKRMKPDHRIQEKPPSASPAKPSDARHCVACQPHGPVIDVSCSCCGNGPLITGQPDELGDQLAQAVPVIRHHRLRVDAGLRVVGWVGGWRSWTPVFICR